MKTNRFLAAAGFSLALALTFSCSGDDGKDGSACSLDGKILTCGDQSFDLQGGSDGADGVSIVWKGELATAPSRPELNWAYYNTTDKKSYVWNGTVWQIMVQDGASSERGDPGKNGTDGTGGKDGTDGTDGSYGVSIVWKGELATAPESPEMNWAYYNTTDKKSYVWDGTVWHIIIQDGSSSARGDDGKDGADGADGQNGADGKKCTITEDRNNYIFNIDCEGTSSGFGFCGPNLSGVLVAYNTGTHYCQFRAVLDRCGGLEYDHATEECCAATIFDPSKQQCCSNTALYSPTTHYCQDDTILDFCGGLEYDHETHYCQDDIVFDFCGGKEYDHETQRCCGTTIYAPSDTDEQVCYNRSKFVDRCGTRKDAYDSDLYQCKPDINPNGIYLKTPVSYGGKNYEAVLIGTKTWMAENLNYETAEGSMCHGNNPARCDVYGRLYEWNAAVISCPSGWHISTNDEWNALVQYVQADNENDNKPGIYLKSPNAGGEDKYGFGALMGCASGSGFSQCVIGSGNGYWWTNGQTGPANGIYRQIVGENVPGLLGMGKERFMSVRCVMN